MTINWPVAVCALIVAVIGAMHLVYTLFGTELHPREETALKTLRSATLRVSHGASMWRAWIGFNASHSLGLILFGAIYGYLALLQPAVLELPALSAVGAGFLATIVLIAKRFWFSVPFIIMSVALVLYLAGMVMAHG